MNDFFSYFKEQNYTYQKPFKIGLEKYCGLDFSSVCFCFGGQGSNFNLMFKYLFDNNLLFQKRIKFIDDIFIKKNYSPLSFFFTNPSKIKSVQKQIYENLVLFLAQITIFESLSKYFKIDLITSHSFGEYAALFCSGIMNFEDIIKVILLREFLTLENSSQGNMIAVKTNQNNIKKILPNHNYEISNINSKNQIVISVPRNFLENVINIFNEQEITYKNLSVMYPYHSSMMQKINEQYIEKMKNLGLNYYKPHFPFLSSVTKKVINAENFCVSEIDYILKNQLIESVNFVKQLKILKQKNIGSFVEISPKKILCSFLDNGFNRIFYYDYLFLLDDVKNKKDDSSLTPKNSKLFSSINKIVSKLTGYGVEDISIHDRFQEDLGVDSIKKAEIILDVVEEEKIDVDDSFNTSSFDSILDLIKYLEEPMSKKSTNKKKQEVEFKLKCLSAVKTDLNEYMNFDYDLNIKYMEFSHLFKYHNLKNVDVLCINEINKIKNMFEISFFKKFDELIKQSKIRHLVIELNEKSSAYFRAFAAFLKSYKLENYEIGIHIVRNYSSNKLSYHEIIEFCKDSINYEIVIPKKGNYYLPVLDEIEISKQNIISTDDVFIFVGGAKGITKNIAKQVALSYSPKIILLGRTSKTDEKIQKTLHEFYESGCVVDYFSIDASFENQMRNVFEIIMKKYGKIDFIINGAGFLDVKLLSLKKNEIINKEVKSKIDIYNNIIKIVVDLNLHLKKIINFTSIVSFTGFAGQTIYSFVNEYINESGIQSSLPVSSINWPPWEGEGMASNKGIKQRLKEFGAVFLSEQDGYDFFENILLSNQNGSFYVSEDMFERVCTSYLSDFKSFFPIIGQPYDKIEFQGEKAFLEKTFSLNKDSYLLDHTYNSYPVIPSAVMLSMFDILAKFYFKKDFYSFYDYEIYNMLYLDSDKNVKIKSGFSGDDFFLNIKSTVSHSKIFLKKDTPLIEKIRLPKFIIQFDLSTIYSDYYFQETVVHKDSFQLMDSVFLTNDKNICIKMDVNKFKPFWSGNTYHDVLAHLLDGFAQNIMCYMVYEMNAKAIPLSIGQLKISQNLDDEIYYSQVEFIKKDENKFYFNGKIFNEKGQVKISIKNFVSGNAVVYYKKRHINYFSI